VVTFYATGGKENFDKVKPHGLAQMDDTKQNLKRLPAAAERSTFSDFVFLKHFIKN